MPTYLKIDGNPDEVSGTGALIKAQAEAFAGKAQGILSEIDTLEGGAPWGADATGQSFHHQYTAVPQGSDKPFNEALRDELQNAGKDLTKTGDGVILAMTGYQSNDTTSASDISRVKDQ